jgi:hypothetical protein
VAGAVKSSLIEVKPMEAGSSLTSCGHQAKS